MKILFFMKFRLVRYWHMLSTAGHYDTALYTIPLTLMQNKQRRLGLILSTDLLAMSCWSVAIMLLASGCAAPDAMPSLQANDQKEYIPCLPLNVPDAYDNPTPDTNSPVSDRKGTAHEAQEDERQKDGESTIAWFCGYLCSKLGLNTVEELELKTVEERKEEVEGVMKEIQSNPRAISQAMYMQLAKRASDKDMSIRLLAIGAIGQALLNDLQAYDRKEPFTLREDVWNNLHDILMEAWESKRGEIRQAAVAVIAQDTRLIMLSQRLEKVFKDNEYTGFNWPSDAQKARGVRLVLATGELAAKVSPDQVGPILECFEARAAYHMSYDVVRTTIQVLEKIACQHPTRKGDIIQILEIIACLYKYHNDLRGKAEKVIGSIVALPGQNVVVNNLPEAAGSEPSTATGTPRSFLTVE